MPVPSGINRPLHRPRRVETELALGALLGVGAVDSDDDEAQQRDDNGGDSDSLMLVLPARQWDAALDGDGGYETMAPQRLSTFARLPAR